jgi:hypothetical protein
MSPDPSAAIRGRLDALEAENRVLGARLRRTRVGFAVVVSMAFVEATASAFLARRTAETPPPPAPSTSSLTPHYPGIVEVQGLILRDVTGARIATLGPAADGLSPTLKFFAGG